MQTNALNFECLRDKGFLPFFTVNHLKNGVFMQEFLRKFLICVLFYEYCAFCCELCDFS